MPSIDPDVRARRQALRARCVRVHGDLRPSPAEHLARVARWCEEQGLDHQDVYGTGRALQDFEARVAELLGFDAARFMPSGTMAQQIALRIWADRAGLRDVGMHPTSHVELHEERGYAHLHGLRSVHVGPAGSPLLAEHLRAVPGRLAALLFELPAREIGGQLPTWEQLEALKAAARDRGLPLHLDGARLWECAPAYGRALPAITAGCASAYVSFYKGIGALPGSMLLGDREFIDEAAVWQRRHGGNLYTLLPNMASAAMQLDERLAQMPAWLERARSVAAEMAAVPGVRVLPDPPHTNLFHVFIDLDPEAAMAARDELAESTGLWLYEYAGPTDRPGTSRIEYTVGEAAMELEPGSVRSGFGQVLDRRD